MVKWDYIRAEWKHKRPNWKCWLFHRSHWHSQNSPWWANFENPTVFCRKCGIWWREKD